MPRIISKTLLVILISVCLLPFVMDTMLLTYLHEGSVPGVEIAPERFTDGSRTLVPRILKEGESKEGAYTAVITGEELAFAEEGGLALLVSRMNGQGCRAYFNGVMIGAAGDPERGRANIWNSAFVFPVDTELIQPENELTLIMHHEYGAGIEGMVLLTDPVAANKILGNISFATNTLSGISIGIAFCACIMILFIILLNQHRRRHSPLIYMVFSLVALAVYALDFTYFPYLPFSYLIYKKIVMTALFIALAGAAMTVSKVFYRKLPMIAGFATLAGMIFAVAVSRDMVAFKHIYEICIILIPVNIVIWLETVIPCYRIKEEAKIFFYGIILFLFVITYNIIVMYAFSGMLSGSVFPYIAVYLGVVILLMTLDIKRKNETIEQESSRRFHFYRKAITDGLTGLFNRDYMISHLEREKPPFAVAMLDIDNFKTVNDDYGHQAGDRMIQFAGKMLSSSLRDTDKVGRYGGDEFIVILHSCGPNAYSIMERFRAEIAHNCQAVENNLLSITFSIGICYILEEESADQILRKADKALYLAKQNGRNMVCMYE